MPKLAGARVFIAAAAVITVLGGCTFVEKIDKLVIENIYEGSERILPVTASVRVTVSGRRITHIALLSHLHGPDHGADALLPRVIEAQSLQVDAVSGSTYSSKVVRKAIERALTKGL